MMTNNREDDSDSREEDTDPVASETVLIPTSGLRESENNVWRKKAISEYTPTENAASSYSGESSNEISDARKYFSVLILFLVNLLNYMDRFTIAGVLLQIQEFFQINNSQAGLLQTAFVVSYMATAPLFGYLGDRFNRKLIVVGGILFWSGATISASFINSSQHFWLFMLFRALVGVGEASYSTIAPTIIGDLFPGEKRVTMLACFFFAIPVGSGLGYVVGSAAASAFGSWHWALRVTPGIGLLTVAMMIIVMPNVQRIASHETSERKSYKADLKAVLKNKTYLMVTFGFTCMAFMAGGLSFWGPKFIAYSQIVAGKLTPCSSGECDYTDLSFKFGLIICLSGFGGVIISSMLSKYFRKKYKNADPIICGVGLLVSASSIFVAYELTSVNMPITWLFMFISNLFMSFTWTPCTDMTLAVTMPARRATANAVQILILHLLGDAGSPYIIGLIADQIQVGKQDTYLNKFSALKYSFYISPFLCAIGGLFFLLASLFIVADVKRVTDATSG